MGPLGRFRRAGADAEWKTERVTSRARKALHLAEEEAQRLRHAWLGTHHVLLGLLRERDGLAGQVLRRHGLELGRLREGVAAVGDASGPASTLAGSAEQAAPLAKRRLVERAHDQARALGHDFVGTEHLLLAVLRETDGAAPVALRMLGADPEAVSADVLAAVAVGGRVGLPSGTKDHVVTCRVDDHALDAIDALVAAGIRSTRSDAAGWLIRSGIDANREFFAQVYATVGEIRRLRAEAQALSQQHEPTQ
jgi:ATP-dependent Clp protease ATP-binding subunit ClpA